MKIVTTDARFRIQIYDVKKNESRTFSIYEESISLNELYIKLMRFIENLKINKTLKEE